MKYLLLIHCNSGCKIAFQYYVIRTLTVLFFLNTSRPTLGPTLPLTLWRPNQLRGDKETGLVADLSLPSNNGLRNACNCASSPPYIFNVLFETLEQSYVFINYGKLLDLCACEYIKSDCFRELIV